MRNFSLASVVASGLLAAACGGTSGPTTPARTAGDVVVRTIVPVGGATGVDPAAPIVIAFDHAMMQGMEALVVLHEGSVTGTTVAGTATWSSDRTQLTFTPAAPLEAQTTYVLHLSPDLVDRDSAAVNYSACANAVGGTAASAGMFGGGGMMGGGGMGSGMGPGMMGSGWQPTSGTWGYGMLVTFTTA